MENVTIEDAEHRWAELAHRAEQGETIVSTRDGKPVANLGPPKKGGIDYEGGRRYLRELGIDKVVTYIAPDFDDPLLEDFLIAPLPVPEAGRTRSSCAILISCWQS